MDGLFFFMGIALAAIIMFAVYNKAKKVIQKTVRSVRFDPLLSLLRQANINDIKNISVDEGPRSLNGCDSLLLPQIINDFPDFDAFEAKRIIKKAIEEHLSGRREVCIHNIVIAKYHRAGIRKTITFQVAVAYQEQGTKMQKRFDVDYVFAPETNNATIASNCPSCGGAIGYGEVECSYCGSRVVNIMGETWKVADIKES